MLQHAFDLALVRFRVSGFDLADACIDRLEGRGVTMPGFVERVKPVAYAWILGKARLPVATVRLLSPILLRRLGKCPCRTSGGARREYDNDFTSRGIYGFSSRFGIG